MNPASKLRTFLYLIIPPIAWAGNAVVGKFANDLIGPFSLSFYRWSIASILILIIAARPLYQARKAIIEHLGILIVFGILGTCLFNTFLYWGLTYTSANNSSIILASMPIAIIGLSFALGIEKTNALQLLGLFISILGVLWVITSGKPQQIVALYLNPGDLIVLTAVGIWAMYSVSLKKWRPNNIDALPFLAIQILIGTVFILPFYLYELSTLPSVQWQSDIFWILAFVAIFPSLIAHYFWQQGIALGGANIAGLFVPFISLFTGLFAFIFIDERLNTAQLIGAGMIILGVILAFLNSFKATKGK